jgi:hypothetical protein
MSRLPLDMTRAAEMRRGRGIYQKNHRRFLAFRVFNSAT